MVKAIAFSFISLFVLGEAMASQEKSENLFQYFTTKNLTSEQINNSWPDWRARCKAYGKCWFRNKLYISELDPNARMGDGQRVRPVSQEEFEKAPYRGPKEVLTRFNEALPTGVAEVDQRRSSQMAAPAQPGNRSSASATDSQPRPSAAASVAPTPSSSSGPRRAVTPSGGPSGVRSGAVPTSARAPVAPQVRGGKMVGQGCGSYLRQPVVEKMKRCMASQNYTIPKNCPITILDAERRRFMVVSRSVVTNEKSPRCFMNVPAGIAGRAGRGNPRPGNGRGSGMTPAGLFVTKVHGGSRYNSRTSVGIRCVKGGNSTNWRDCSNTVGRGVIIHGAKKANGRYGANPRGTASTLGCTRLSQANFDSYHKNFVAGGRKNCPYFVYFDEGNCGKGRPSPSQMQAFNQKNGVATGRNPSGARQ